jgi:hypothetical protein
VDGWYQTNPEINPDEPAGPNLMLAAASVR